MKYRYIVAPFDVTGVSDYEDKWYVSRKDSTISDDYSNVQRSFNSEYMHKASGEFRESAGLPGIFDSAAEAAEALSAYLENSPE